MSEIRPNPNLRRQGLRLIKGSISPEEFAATWATQWVTVNNEPTPEQWAEIGRFNGRMFG
jgi:hypothetical protein